MSGLNQLLSLASLQNLSTKRLINYRKKIFSIIQSYYCPCCGEPEWVYRGKCYSDKEIKSLISDHENLIEYKKSINRILYSRDDFNKSVSEIRSKIKSKETSKNKGCQSLKKQAKKHLKNTNLKEKNI